MKEIKKEKMKEKKEISKIKERLTKLEKLVIWKSEYKGYIG